MSDLPEIEYGSIHAILNGFFVVTSVNWATEEFTAAFFATEEEARNTRHDWSLKQQPEWHRVNCACTGPTDLLPKRKK